jgi:hypothetical protein
LNQKADSQIQQGFPVVCLGQTILLFCLFLHRDYILWCFFGIQGRQKTGPVPVYNRSDRFIRAVFSSYNQKMLMKYVFFTLSATNA